MTWFSLPITQMDNKAAFADADSAGVWLGGQPQANAPAMQAEFARQIPWLNGYTMPVRERFKTLEVLRKAIFAVDAECQRRYEGRPLPLSSGEQGLLDTSRRLWRACANGYLHCLRACLDGEPTVAGEGARVAHRAMASLRMEQTACYAGGSQPDGEFWRTVHAVFAAAEQLGVDREPVADRLLGETSESSICGQYAMLLLLHLARPFDLTRGQFSATTRWFARWREQAEILDTLDNSRKGNCIALDLSLAAPFHHGIGAAGMPRWLGLSGVLRKMRKRLEALALGETPSSLKLGSGLTADACTSLLKTLAEHLKTPPQPPPAVTSTTPEVLLVGGLESIFQQLGGDRLKQPDSAEILRNRRAFEQITLFDHVVRTEQDAPGSPETWKLLAVAADTMLICRAANGGQARFSPRSLVAIQQPGEAGYRLASLSRLYVGNNFQLYAQAHMLTGRPRPIVVSVRERANGKLSRHPAFLLPPLASSGSVATVLLPAGLPARAQAITLQVEDSPPMHLDFCLERGGDYERWTCRSD